MKNFLKLVSLFAFSLPLVCSGLAELDPVYNREDKGEGEYSGQLSMVQAVELAMSYHPILRAAEGRTEISKEKIIQSRARLLPQVSADMSFEHTDSEGISTKNTFEFGGDVSQSIIDLNRYKTLEKTKLLSEAQIHQLEATRQSLISRVANAYLDLLAQRILMDLAWENYKRILDHLEATQIRYDAGELTTTDVGTAKTRLAGSRVQLIQNYSRGVVQEHALEYLIGQTSRRNLNWPNINTGMLEDEYSQKTYLIANHPNVQAARSRLEAASKDYEIARMDFLPTVSVSGDASRTWGKKVRGRGNPLNDYSLSVGLSIPIWNGGTRFSKLREARHSQYASKADYDNTELLTILQVETVLMDLKSARDVMETLEVGVESAQTALNGVMEEFQAGTRTAKNVLDAQEELFGSQTSLIRSRITVLKSKIGLMSAAGKLNLNQLRTLAP